MGDDCEEEKWEILLHGGKEVANTDATAAPRQPKWKSLLACACLWLAYLFCNIAYSCVIPFFPGRARDKGATFFEIGIIISLAPLTVTVLSPVLGYLLPRLGIRFVILFGLIFATISLTSLGFVVLIRSPKVFLLVCMCLRITQGTGSAMFTTATFSTFPQLFPNSVGTVMGMFEVAAGLGYTIGPVVGGLFYEIGGYRLPFVVMGGCILTCVIPCASSVGKISLATAFGYSVSSLLSASLEPYLRNKFRLSPLKIGLVVLGSGLAYSVVIFPLGPLSDRVEKNKRIFPVSGLLISAASFLITGVPYYFFDFENVWFIYSTYALLGVGSAVTIVSIYADMLLISEKCQTNSVSQSAVTYFVSGIISCCICLGESVGTFAGGVLGTFFPLPMISLLLGEAITALALFVGGVAVIGNYFTLT